MPLTWRMPLAASDHGLGKDAATTSFNPVAARASSRGTKFMA